MKVLVVSPEFFSNDILSSLNKIAKVTSRNLSYKQLLNQIAEYDAVLTRVDTKFDKNVLRKAKKLKVIGSATTGLNHIDLDYAKERNIHIISLSGTHTLPTAEYTFSLILSLVRKIPWAYNSFSEGLWERHKFFGNNIEGKTLGIIGFGRIGSRVGRYAKSFGMNILTYDPYINKSLAKKIGGKITMLDDLLKKSDIIVLHAYLSPKTKNMITQEAFLKMKPSVFLINTARGEMINEEDLLSALNKKKIAGAALDVFIEEPLSPSSKLLKYAKAHDNLLLTPHIAASTKESVREAATEIVHKVKEFLIGERRF